MKCKLSEKCEFGNLCKDATRHDSLTVLGCSSFKTKEPMTNEQWLHTATTEQLADFIGKAMLFYDNSTMSLLEAIQKATKYEKLGKHMTEDIVEWLKQPHTQ